MFQQITARFRSRVLREAAVGVAARRRNSGIPEAHGKLGAVKIAVLTVIGLAIASVPAVAGTKYKTTWRASEVGPHSFAGKKVAAVVISGDESLRVSSEEALVRELATRGVQGVAAYRFVPKEALRNADTARPFFDRAGLEGVIVLRPISVERERTYTPDIWATPNYGTLWGYYGYGWGSIGGTVTDAAVLTVETLIFSIPRDRLIWAGVSETKDPESVQKVVADLVRSAAKELKKQGLTTQ
jgi:hypothetical protein